MNYRIILYIGLILIIGGFIYDIAFIGIPYQDPTPEIIAERTKQHIIKDIVLYLGVSLSLVGVIAVLMQKRQDIN